MGASLWHDVFLPLLLGVASSVVFAALCFLSVRLWNCLMQQNETHTAAGESAHDQPLPVSDAAAPGNAVPDSEMGNGYGPAEGGESMPEPELELGIVNGGQALNAQVAEDPASGALKRVEMDIPHSQQERAAE